MAIAREEKWKVIHCPCKTNFKENNNLNVRLKPWKSQNDTKRSGNVLHDISLHVESSDKKSKIQLM